MAYPLLFPYGENGWSVDTQRCGIGLDEYIISRMLMVEDGVYYKTSETADDLEGTIIASNRFQVFQQLGQVSTLYLFIMFILNLF